MPSPVNLPAILIANAMGLLILSVIAICNHWRLRAPTDENRSLLVLFISCVSNCITDPLCFLADGKPGLFNRILVIGCNSLLYLGGAVLALTWIYLVASRTKTKLHKGHNTTLQVLFAAICVMLVANLFTPILFVADANNVYSRLPGYWFHIGCYFLFMLDGLLIYIRCYRRSGGLRFFPVWAFLIPAALGLLIQTLWYGVSTSNPFAAVSLVCMMLCMQNEFMHRDRLTGLYNRFYMKTVERLLTRNRKLRYTAVMMDINSFKHINDEFGHKVGDDALIRMAGVLTDSVGALGVVMRYAGDEFILVINTQDEARIAQLLSDINARLDAFNRSGAAPYQLSLSSGHCALDLETNNMDAYLDLIDKHMYLAKDEYYSTHLDFKRHS